MARKSGRSRRGATRKKRVVRSGARRAGLQGHSTDRLRRELERRGQEIDVLREERARIKGRIERLDMEIGALTGARRAPRREGRESLADVLATVLSGRTMSVNEAVDAARGMGYRSNAANFKSMVAQRLSGDPRFKRVGRGQYTVEVRPARRR